MISPKHTSQSGRLSSHCGFSLVELLAAVSIILVLLAISVPAVTSLVDGNATSRAVEEVSNAVTLARQRAMTTGGAVALVISKSAERGVAQGVLLLESTKTGSGNTWLPMGNWHSLPIPARLEIFPRDGMDSFYSPASTVISSALPLKMGNKDVADYAFIVFRPNGTVDAPASGPALTVSRWGKPGSPPDYTVVVQSESGRVKVVAN